MSRCFNLNLSNAQLADLAFQGLAAPIKERFAGQEFESLGHLVQKILAHESQFQEYHKDKFPRRVAQLQSYGSDLELMMP